MSKLSLQGAVRLYLVALHENATPLGTVRAYRSVVNRLAKRLPGRAFSTISTADLQRAMFGPGGLSTGVAPHTQDGHRAAVRSLFRYGQAMGWRRDMPAIPEPVIRSGKRASSTPPTRLTADELLLLLGKAEHPILRGMLAVAMNTALRVSDVQKIQLRDVRFATGEVAVVTQKTGLVDALPITLDLADELRTYLLWYTGRTGRTLLDGESFLFPGFVHTFDRDEYEPGRPIGYNWAYLGLRDLYAACGVQVERREGWHVIRRSVARIYFDSLRGDISFDHALRQTSTLLGHKHASQTETYLGLDAEKAARDESLRGKRLIVPSGNVLPIRQKSA